MLIQLTNDFRQVHTGLRILHKLKMFSDGKRIDDDFECVY